MSAASRHGLFLMLLFAGATLHAQSGYRLTSQTIEVDQARHWRAWSIPSGLVTISPSGSVAPRSLAASVNASLNAGDFTYELAGALRNFYDNSADDAGVLRATGGIKRASSSASSVGRIMDGDNLTYWEPDAKDDLSAWRVEIDLGRLVSATRIVLRFVEDDPEDRADPFYQFRVHTATGQNPFDDVTNASLDYRLAGGTTQPNTDQREFSFDLDPALVHTESWTGRMVQYVRIAVTDRRGGRGEEIGESEYDDLPSADRGDIEFIWLIGGEQRLVDATHYAALTAEEQGGQRFFRRERPRLAEVEVWTAGDNVALTIIDRGGSLQEGNPGAAPELAFDGSIRTNWTATVFSTVGDIAGWGLLRMDLGALLRLHSVRIITRRASRGEPVLFGYLLRGSDGSVAPDGSLIWETLSGDDRLFNQNTRLFEDRFDPRSLRFLEFRNLDTARRTKAHLGNRIKSAVTEIQVYSQGSVPEVVMESDLIDLNDARILRSVTWDADVVEGTSVEIRTRTGDILREVNHYFLSTGEEVTKAEFDKKPSFFQGPVEVETVPGAGWSNFSQAYRVPGEAVLSPSPRRFLIIEARLLASTPDTAATLRSISVATLPPVASQLVAEVSPKSEVAVGEPVDFELYLRSSFAGNVGGGFDRLRLTAPSLGEVVLRGIDLGDEDDFAAATTQSFRRAMGDSLFRDAQGQELSVSGEGTDSLQVELPVATGATGPDLVRLSFTSTVFQSGSTFGLEAASSSSPDIWQSADAGDAVGDELAAGSGLTVLTPLGGGQVRLSDTSSRVFTPNGDGINDQVVFEFAVLTINVDRQVGIDLFDLSGHRVRSLRETRDLANGLYRFQWDGRTDDGVLVPPGIYLVRYEVDSDAGGSTPTGTISVAY